MGQANNVYSVILIDMIIQIRLMDSKGIDLPAQRMLVYIFIDHMYG